MSEEKRWLRVTACENIPAREGRVVEVAGRQVAIFNLGERFLAVENRCLHREGPLADGIVAGTMVACPLHAWKIDLETGKAVDHPEVETCVERFATRVEDGIISIETPLSSAQPCAVETRREHADRPLRWVQRRPLSSAPTSPALPPTLGGNF